MVRRWLRTLRLYVFWLAALALLWPPAENLPGYLLEYGTFTQNLMWPMPGDGWFNVSWSLGVAGEMLGWRPEQRQRGQPENVKRQGAQPAPYTSGLLTSEPAKSRQVTVPPARAGMKWTSGVLA